MASGQEDRITRILNDDGLQELLHGAYAEATQSFIQDFLCGEIPDSSDDGII